MPEEVIVRLRCDAPKCPNIGMAFIIRTDKAAEKKVIVCDDHQQQPFNTVLGWARPNVAPRRRPSRRQSSIEDRLLSTRIDE